MSVVFAPLRDRAELMFNPCVSPYNAKVSCKLVTAHYNENNLTIPLVQKIGTCEPFPVIQMHRLIIINSMVLYIINAEVFLEPHRKCGSLF